MLWTLLGILLTASTVQAQAVSGWDRFRLFNACRPMMLVVEELPSDAQAVGLTRERIQLAAESRLRVARLYTESREKANSAYLYININVRGPAHSMSVRYRKRVTDLATNLNGFASTWHTGRYRHARRRRRLHHSVLVRLPGRIPDWVSPSKRVGLRHALGHSY